MPRDRYDVVIVGAGLAGLRAAQVLDRHGLAVLVIDQSAHIGGRVHSFDVDGFVIDEGFQLVNPSYPELRASGVLPALDLRSFPGVLTFVGANGDWTLADPRRWPARALANAVRGRPRPRDALALARLAAVARLSSATRLTQVTDGTTREGLRDAGISARAIDEVVGPFLRGALLDDQLETSWRYSRLLIKSFTTGRPATPASGVGQLPRALAASASRVEFRLSERVQRVGTQRVLSDEGEWRADAILVATDQDGAASLVGGPTTGWRATTTWWFSTPRVARGERLRLDGAGHGYASMLDLASVAPQRAPAGRSLIAVAINGVDESHADVPARYVARAYGVALRDVQLIVRTVVPRALPRVVVPLDLTRSSRRDGVFVAGDYLQTPSIQGALVSGRRAAKVILADLGVRADARA